MRPSGFEINGIKYRPFSGEGVHAFREYSQPLNASLGEIVGTSRTSKTTRPNELVWVWDDWSGGEGFQYFDLRDELAAKRYYYSSSAVDITVSGKISLGYKLTSSTTSASRKYGPYIASSRGIISFFVDDRMFTQGTLDSWTDRGVVAAAAGNQVRGPVRVHGGFYYAAYFDGTGAGSSSKIRRFIWDGATLTQATFVSISNQENPLPADNRLYFVGDTNGKLGLNRTPLTGTLPLSYNNVYIADNIGSESAVAAIGSRIYVATQYSTTEEPRVHMYDGAKGFERAKLPEGFRMDTTPYDGAAVVNDILFLGGYRAGTTGRPNVPMLAYVAGDTTGSVGLIREFLETARIMTVAPAEDNRILMGTDTGRVYMYDITTGAISQYLDGVTSGDDVTSILYFNGYHWVGSRSAAAGTSGTATLWRSTPSGSSKYVAASTVYGSTWDFGYRESVKTLREIEVVTEPLDAGCTVEVQVVLDGTTVTTDAAGATMTHSGTGATKTTFTLSNATTERNFVYSQPVVLLKTSNTANTPKLLSMTQRAVVSEVQRYFDVWLDLSDEDAVNRRPGAQVSGKAQAENVRTLIENAESRDPATGRLFAFKPYFENASNRPVATQNSYVCYLVDHDLQLSTRGEGFAKLTLGRFSG